MRTVSKGILRFTVILALPVVLSLVSPSPSSAYSFTVNSNGDDHDGNLGDGVCAASAAAGRVCTLRAAVEETNKLGGTNTIIIPPMTITLATLLEVASTSNVTINGAGAGSTIINGNNTTRAFYFKQSNNSRTVSNLTIRNGNVTGNDPVTLSLRAHNGGGILNEANLNLTNVSVENSVAYEGGGIFNMFPFSGYSPTLNLNSVTISGNTATNPVFGEGGGGIFNANVVNGTYVTITGNRAVQGGGFYNNSNHAVTLSHFTISNNVAKVGGGFENDIAYDLTVIHLSDGTISGNIAECCRPTPQYPAGNPPGEPSGGAGIYTIDGTMTLQNVTVSNNVASSSGGYAAGIYNARNLVLNSVTVSGNQAGYGAGIYSDNREGRTAHLSVTNSTISGNIGLSNGVDAEAAGIWNGVNGQLTMVNSTVANNAAHFAGGVENLPGALGTTLHNTIVAANSVAYSSPDCRGAITSNGYNLIGSTSGCSFAASTGDKLNVNPWLGPLQNNGGTTVTQAIGPGSPALDGGSNTGCPATDQRGVARPKDGNNDGKAVCDIGAYEYVYVVYNHAIFLPLLFQ